MVPAAVEHDLSLFPGAAVLENADVGATGAGVWVVKEVSVAATEGVGNRVEGGADRGGGDRWIHRFRGDQCALTSLPHSPGGRKHE